MLAKLQLDRPTFSKIVRGYLFLAPFSSYILTSLEKNCPDWAHFIYGIFLNKPKIWK